MLRDLKSERRHFIVLAGDLAGFSTAHAGNYIGDVEKFITRYYQLVSACVAAAEGTLVKFIGDGYLATFPLLDDERERRKVCVTLQEMAVCLSALLRTSNLGITLSTPVHLRQGITIEDNGIHLTYTRDDRSESDVLGRAVNLAFRLQSIATKFPYIVAQKHLMTWMGPTDGRWQSRPISVEELRTKFKSVKNATDEIYELDLSDQESLLHDQAILGFKAGFDSAVMGPAYYPWDEPEAIAFHERLDTYIVGKNCTADWMKAKNWRVWLTRRMEVVRVP